MSEKLLTSMVHIFYAIPPNWPRGSNWERILPSIMAILIWLAFCMEMSIIKLLWTQGDQGHAANKHPPIGSVLLVILLELSSTVSFTIMVIYFFKSSNRFHYSSTKLTIRKTSRRDTEESALVERELVSCVCNHWSWDFPL